MAQIQILVVSCTPCNVMPASGQGLRSAAAENSEVSGGKKGQELVATVVRRELKQKGMRSVLELSENQQVGAGILLCWCVGEHFKTNSDLITSPQH